MRGFWWWWQRDNEILEQIKLYREERRLEKQEKREARREQRDYVAIVIALFAASFTWWQAWEAHGTRKDTQAQFEQAQKRADRDADQARKDAREAVAVQTNLADQSAEQAKRSADAASAANKIAIAAMQQGQRPWIGPDLRAPVTTEGFPESVNRRCELPDVAVRSCEQHQDIHKMEDRKISELGFGESPTLHEAINKFFAN